MPQRLEWQWLGDPSPAQRSEMTGPGQLEARRLAMGIGQRRPGELGPRF